MHPDDMERNRNTAQEVVPRPNALRRELAGRGNNIAIVNPFGQRSERPILVSKGLMDNAGLIERRLFGQVPFVPLAYAVIGCIAIRNVHRSSPTVTRWTRDNTLSEVCHIMIYKTGL